MQVTLTSLTTDYVKIYKTAPLEPALLSCDKNRLLAKKINTNPNEMHTKLEKLGYSPYSRLAYR
jgi:hypothetical protein